MAISCTHTLLHEPLVQGSTQGAAMRGGRAMLFLGYQQVCVVGPVCLGRDVPCRLEGGPGSGLLSTSFLPPLYNLSVGFQGGAVPVERRSAFYEIAAANAEAADEFRPQPSTSRGTAVASHTKSGEDLGRGNMQRIGDLL